MKIIEKKAPWWPGCRMHCKSCGCVTELEDTDECPPQVTYDNFDEYRFLCIECNAWRKFSRRPAVEDKQRRQMKGSHAND